METIDYIAFGLFILQYAGYQLLYLSLSKKHVWETRDRVIGSYREKWLSIINKTDQSILAIQTIRNLTMTNTFFISIAMLLAGGLVSIFTTNPNWIQILEKGLYLEFLLTHPAAVKILVALSLLIISATNFIFSLRILYNMNFTTSAAVGLDSYSFHIEQIERHNRHFIVGVRAIYYFIAPMLWVIHPLAMILYTFTATYIFFHFDFRKIRRDE